MSLPELSIRRPVFVSCLFFLILGLGIVARGRLGVTLYPDASYPIVNVVVPYPGAGPEEVENQVSKPIEDALSQLPGIRTLRSSNLDGAAVVTAVFGMDTDIRFAEQKIQLLVSRIRGQLPSEIREPVVESVDPTEVPVVTLSLAAALPNGGLYDLADREIRPLLEEVPEVGRVDLQGSRKREIQVELDLDKLNSHEVTASEVVSRLEAAGINAPAGVVLRPDKQTLIRTLGRFRSLREIGDTPIRFVGNENPLPLRALGQVKDGLEDERARVYVDGRRALTFRVFRQSGGNTVRISDEVARRVRALNADFRTRVPGFELQIVRDGARPIRDSVQDASLAIGIGVALTIIVVLLFLGNLRSTIITGLALPNSLLGAFLLMWVAGFTVNITTLAALSLAVGLLIDDAIVVRENIFRKIQAGEESREAAIHGTREVTLAVVATTLTVISVFGPISFMKGLIGQFFRQFGLTLCFAMLISLLDSLTIAPMLSAHFAGPTRISATGLFRAFERLQKGLERAYMRVLASSLNHRKTVLLAATAVFALSFLALARIPKSFLPPGGAYEFTVSLELPPGTSLDAMDRMARSADEKVRTHKEVRQTVLSAGGENGEANQAEILVQLRPSAGQSLSTRDLKETLRQELQEWPAAEVRIQDVLDIGGGAGQPFDLHLRGDDLAQLRRISDHLAAELRKSPDLTDVGTSYQGGAPELQIQIDPARAEKLGMPGVQAEQELRILMAGATPTLFHEHGADYEVRVRLREDQRDPALVFPRLYAGNLNHRLLPLSAFSRLVNAAGAPAIYRENRRRIIEVTASVNPRGRGLASALSQTRALLKELPPGVSYEFSGQTRDFQDLLSSIAWVLGLSVGFMYLVLASLYESFFTPLSILLVLPLAICGAFYALFVTRSSIDIYSMVGCILLLGVAAKNSILLVDYISEGVRGGKGFRAAILDAGRIRLRPIMMTSFALVAGMLPVALPLQESARTRSGMAVAVIGGIVTSTLLTLVVIPAAYQYIDQLNAWALSWLHRGKPVEKPRELESGIRRGESNEPRQRRIGR